MSRLIDDETGEKVREALSGMDKPVKIILFTRDEDCEACGKQRDFLDDFIPFSDKIELTVFDISRSPEEARRYGIERVPATVVEGEGDHGIRFYGITAGYEFSSFLETVMMVSSGHSGLEPQLEALVRSIGKPVHLEIMVTLTCPYCPALVHTAHQFAYANDNIRADMVDGSIFPEMSRKYDVTGVPKTIINGTHSFDGALPAGSVFMEILKAVSPDEYEKLDEAIREARGMKKTLAAEEGRTYDIIIVGGGPAALSAAVYAHRKGLDILLLAQKIGGQITYTAQVENYLGLPGIEGREMAERFRNHVERYPIAEARGIEVVRVERTGSVFTVTGDDGRVWRASSLVYCAGKEYKRLGVPGEERFIGHGIAFCATCDAPLYREKRVAVVGGGNSALTAVRDLLGFADEIHIVHRREAFRADEALVSKFLASKKVKVHAPRVVASFLGEERLEGIQLRSVDGTHEEEVLVDGVFLEIGLTPNSGPLVGLVTLNERGEVQVGKDMSAGIPGLFAAGDVTDVPEKQIAIAVGQGALAALSAHKYLVSREMVDGKVGVREEWE